MKAKIIIADDHPIVIQGIRDMLDKDGHFDVLATFNDGRSLLQSPELAHANILLLDLNMPGADGLRVVGQLKKMALQLKTIVITSYFSSQLVEQCKAAGASGYLVKSNDLHQLIASIQQVMDGEEVFPDFSQRPFEAADDYSYFDEFLKKHKLTKREVEIIRMVCHDLSSKDIAEKLFLSNFTVQTHRRNIIKKLGLDDSKISLYKFAHENGVI